MAFVGLSALRPRQSLRRCRVALPAVLVAAAVFAGAAAAQDACPRIMPLKRLKAVNIYFDSKGAMPDQQAQQHNAEQRAELTAFLKLLHEAYDKQSAIGKQACASELITRWASDEALLLPPTAATARVERVLAAVAINSMLVKRARAGALPSKHELEWIRKLTEAVGRDYHRDALAGTPFFRNNTYFWSMAAQGLHAVLTGDSYFINVSDIGWRDALAMIDAEGFLAAELKRGRRAIVYHQFSYSALLILRETRYALGLGVTAADLRAMRRLSGTIGKALCGDGRMLARAQVRDLEKPGDWGFRVASVFGLDINGADWDRCGTFIKDPVDLRLGGDLKATKRALAPIR